MSKKPRKIVITLTLVMLLIFAAAENAIAGGLGDAVKDGLQQVPVIGSFIDAYNSLTGQGGGENKPSFMEKQVARLINSLYNGLYAIGVQDIQELVFNKKMDTPGTFISEELTGRPRIPDYYGVFYNKEVNDVILPLHVSFTAIAWLFCVGSMIMGGSQLSASAINTKVRVNLIDMLWNWIVATVLLTFSWFIVDLFLYGNSLLVKGFASYGNIDQQAYSFYDLGWSRTAGDGGVAVFDGVLSVAVIKLVALGLGLVLNFSYVARHITLLVLAILAPIFCGLWFFDKTRGVFWGWVKEMFSIVFVQSIHAFILMLFFMIDSLQDYWLFKVAFLMAIIPTTEVLRKLIGAGGSQNGMLSGAMMGMGLGSVLGTVGLLGKAGSAVKGIGGGEASFTGGGGSHPVFSDSSQGTPGAPSGFDNIAKGRSVAGTVGKVMGMGAGMLVGAGMGNPFMIANMGQVGAAMGSGSAATIGGLYGAGKTLYGNRGESQDYGWHNLNSADSVMLNSPSALDNTLNTGVEGWMEQDGKTAGEMRGYNAGHMIGHALFGEGAGNVLGKVGKTFGGRGVESQIASSGRSLSQDEGARMVTREYANRTETWQKDSQGAMQLIDVNGHGNPKAGNGYVETEYVYGGGRQGTADEHEMKYRPVGRPMVNFAGNIRGEAPPTSVDGVRFGNI